MQTKIEMMQIPVVSTSHLTKQVADQLSKQGDNNPWVICAPYDCGFFLWVSYDQDAAVDMPQCLQDVRDALGNHLPNSTGVWVRLDCDGDTIDAPVYEW